LASPGLAERSTFKDVDLTIEEGLFGSRDVRKHDVQSLRRSEPRPTTYLDERGTGIIRHPPGMVLSNALRGRFA
jgi:hypothetical protein